MSGLSDSEMDYLDQAMQEENDDQRAYHEDQRRMLEQAQALVDQLSTMKLITKHETALLNFFIK